MKPWGPYLLNDLKCDHPQEKGNFGVDMCTTHSYSKTKEACFNTKQTRQPISILHHKMEIRRFWLTVAHFSFQVLQPCYAHQFKTGDLVRQASHRTRRNTQAAGWDIDTQLLRLDWDFNFPFFFKVSPSEEATRPQGNNDHYFIALIRTQAKNALQWNGPEFGCNCSPHFQW